ncbi:hypothetical protein Q3G72_033721 [Acer saccharum]|nr:hypothetical protein Q3G72_033721 [Acer saccharum]
MMKTLLDEHECHRVYNNKNAKVKWIASKFENLVKTNPSFSIKVIGYLLRENYRVSVDVQRLYNAKKKALAGGEHYKKLFWRAIRSCNVFKFNEAINEIGAIDPPAKSWLQNIETEYWSRFVYDPIIRCDHVTNNMTEAFNNMLGSHRAKSYLELLEFIRRMVMRKFQERKDECEAWNSVLPPGVNAKILKNSKESMLFTIIEGGNGEYELLGPTRGYGLKLREYSCQCGYLQMSEIPYSHAMAAISHYCGKSVTKDKISDFVHQSLGKSAYL